MCIRDRISGQVLLVLEQMNDFMIQGLSQEETVVLTNLLRKIEMCIRDSDVDCRFAFCFPDTYEIGMSNLGMRILYGVINEMDGVWLSLIHICGPGSLDAERELPWLRRLLRLVLEK